MNQGLSFGPASEGSWSFEANDLLKRRTFKGGFSETHLFSTHPFVDGASGDGGFLIHVVVLQGRGEKQVHSVDKRTVDESYRVAENNMTGKTLNLMYLKEIKVEFI